MKSAQVITVIFFALVVSACGGPKTQQPIDNCWSEDTKRTALSLARDIVVEEIANIIKRDEGTITDERKHSVADRTSLDFSNFYVANNNPDIGHLTCGASTHFTFKRLDNETRSASGFIEFEVYKGENGNLISVPKAALLSLIVNSTSAGK